MPVDVADVSGWRAWKTASFSRPGRSSPRVWGAAAWSPRSSNSSRSFIPRHAATDRRGGAPRSLHRQGRRPLHRRAGPFRHSVDRDPRLRQKIGQQRASFVTRFQYALFEPKDPSQPITGVMHFLVANFLASGGSIILDLQGPTGTEVNGLPTHLYWVHDGTSGTEFTGTGSAIPGFANFPTNYFTPQGTPADPPPGPNGPNPSSVNNWNLGFGDATFQYIPDPHPVPGSVQSGKVVLVFKGLLNTSDSQNPADKHYM